MSDERTSRLLQRGLDVLEQLATARGALGTRELAEALEMSPSTCHRLLLTLQERGYVRQDEHSRRWSLGLKLLELGVTLINGSGLPSLARPYLEALAQATNETVFLGVRDGDSIVYIDTILSPQSIQTAVSLGSRWQLHCGALGKVLLAALPDAEVERILQSDLRVVTSATITDPTVLREQIAAVRANGYALNFGETVEGVFCAAAALRDHRGKVVAAIGAAGPASRIGDANVPRFIDLVVTTADQISLQLGYHRASHRRVSVPSHE